MGIAEGKRALVVGVANDRSIAWSITQELAKQGAQIAMTYQGEALKKRVEPLAEQVARTSSASSM
jgi:enoyl-[acyl-carrier protein] reductase I